MMNNMRRLMTISEGFKSNFKSGPFERFYQQVIDEGSMMFGADEDEIGREDVKEWIKIHRQLFRKSQVTVYRTMQLEPEFIENLQPNAELGQHWTFEFDDHNIEGFNINLSKREKGIYVFEGTVTSQDVLFPLSVAYNVYFPHEKELFLHLHASIALRSIKELNLEPWYIDEDNLRPDLVGKVFRV